MKLEVIFLAAVLGIAGLHSLFSLVKYLARFNRTSVQKSREEKAHDGWYVFFEKSALYGDLADTAEEAVNIIESEPAIEDSRHAQESFA